MGCRRVENHMLGRHAGDHMVGSEHVAVTACDQDHRRLGTCRDNTGRWDVVGEEVVRDEVVVSRRMDDAVEVVEAVRSVDERREPFRATA